jgi:hypothetical protein
MPHYLFPSSPFSLLQRVLSQMHFALVGGVVSQKFVMVICDIARLSGDWEVSQLALALLAICIARDLTHSITNLLCKEPEILRFLITTALMQEKLNKKVCQSVLTGRFFENLVYAMF